jgi:DNA mismatch repair protein MutS2
MNSQAFKILEFDSLRALLRRGGQTALGRARVDALEPIDSFAVLQRALREVAEALELRKRGARFSFADIADPTEAIARLKIEGTALEPLAILDLVRVCTAAMDARSAVWAERENCPALFEIVAPLSPELKKLATAITKKILPSGEIDDRASPELARVRHDIARLRSSITRSLENLMRRSSEAIQEELVTVRNDRFVIPVRADHRGRINGVAHGSSSSGATIFIEPMQTIEANNELQTLREAEQREIAEILFSLSEDLRRELVGIEAAATAITQLDFVTAKASFGERFNCVVPEVSEPGAVATGSQNQVEGNDPVASPTPRGVPARGPWSAPGSDAATLEFIDARHPLLEENLRGSGGSVVPVSFTLDEGKQTMVISGANAGGKTVVLKTAGLLSLMALSGLPVSAREARVPFYRSILADIGDHQSLAANLSTFTSHVANIASMIETCEAPALVLLDEVGTGTDPEEGSALGVAVVDHFRHKGAHVLATTHYSGLKMYAANEPGVLNASVEFDEKTLRPTYRLLVGLAGSSSGLEIARRFGIPAEVVDKANEQVKKSSRDAIEYLRRIKQEAEEAESLRHALEEERAATAEKFAKLDLQFLKRERERQTEFEKELSATVADFENKTRALVAGVQERADRVKVEREAEKRAAELKREAQKAAAAAKKASQVTKSQRSEEDLPAPLRGVRVVRDGKVVSGGQEESGRDVRAPSDPNVRSVEEREIRVGDRVRLLSFGSTGVVDGIKNGEAEVRVGSLHMREKLSNLELIRGTGVPSVGHAQDARATSDRDKPSFEDLRRRAATTELHLHSKDANSKFQSHSELNLIGKKTDEAVDLTDKFLDQAFLNGLSEVRIIHGHGTGALRKAVAEFLNNHPHVARFAAAPQDQGGTGATLVQLKS